MLQLGDRIRRPHVFLAAHAPRVLAAGIERAGEHRVALAERGLMDADRFLGNPEHVDAPHRRSRAGEILVHQRPGKAHRLEDLRAGVRHVSGNAHLRHHLLQPLANRLDVVLYCLARGRAVRRVKREQCFEREVWVHRFRPVAAKQRELVHFARGAGLDHEAGGGTQPLPYQVLVDGREGEQRRDRDSHAVDQAVGHDDDGIAGTHRVLGLRGERGKARFHCLLTPRDRVGDVEFQRTELATGIALDVADLLHLVEVEHRLAHLEAQRRVHLVDAEQVRLRPDEGDKRRYQLFADWVDRRVGDLREQLLEIVI